MDNKREISEPTSSLESNKRLKRLTIPKRIKRLDETLKKKLDIIVNTVTKNDHEYECNLCGEILKEPYPRPLKRLIDAVRKNEKEFRKEQEAEHIKLVNKCNSEFVPPLTYIKGGISKNDQSFICRIHKIELVFKPLAIERGYPTTIEFEKLDERIKAFEPELKDIIDGRIKSTFLEKVLSVHEKLGSMKARQAAEFMTRFEQTLPGYYGNRGSHYIMETLNEIFLKSDYLDKKKTSPLTPIEYLQQVLVPESGMRLIKEDLNLINLHEACKVMEESSEYGSIVYNKLKQKK